VRTPTFIECCSIEEIGFRFACAFSFAGIVIEKMVASWLPDLKSSNCAVQEEIFCLE
jgi:hypothetical protein